MNGRLRDVTLTLIREHQVLTSTLPRVEPHRLLFTDYCTRSGRCATLLVLGGPAEVPPEDVEDDDGQDDEPAAGAAQVGDEAVAEGEKEDGKDESDD